MKNNILKIYIYYFFRSFIWAYVIERLFWASRGMSITDTVATEFIYAAVILMLEVPSGLWADRFKRKTVIIVSAVINVLAAIIILNAYGLFWFGLVVAISGIHGSLSSGSVNALVYDSLVELGQTHRFERIIANVKIIRNISGLGAALIGAFAADRWGLLLPYQVSLVSTILSALAVLSLVEPARHFVQADEDEKPMLRVGDIAKLTVDVLKKDGTLRRMMTSAALISGTIVYFEEFWQNYFVLLSTPTAFFGLISGAMALSAILASVISPKLTHYLRAQQTSEIRRYAFLWVPMTAATLFTGLVLSNFTLLFMCLAVVVAAITENMIISDLHHRVSSSFRATMESVYSMLERTIVIIMGIVFGILSDMVSLQAGFIGLAVFGVLIRIMLYVLQRIKPSSQLVS